MISSYSNKSSYSISYKGASMSVSGKKADYIIYASAFLLTCIGVLALSKSN